MEYENGVCDCIMGETDIPMTSIYLMVCELKKSLESVIAEQAQGMGITTQEGFDEFIGARFEFEQMKLDK